LLWVRGLKHGGVGTKEIKKKGNRGGEGGGDKKKKKGKGRTYEIGVGGLAVVSRESSGEEKVRGAPEIGKELDGI